MSTLRRYCGDFANRAWTPPTLLIAPVVASYALLASPSAHADNKRLNDSVVNDVYTIQQRAGCTNDVKIQPQLRLAAQRHVDDMMANRSLDGDIGSDGSTPQDRAAAAGFHGKVAETVAINPAVAISSLELMNQWYNNPADLAIMSNCANNAMGVWSENSLDRTVVVAVYGEPDEPPRVASNVSASGPEPLSGYPPTDPYPDYDASDEVLFGFDWFGWILRGVYPPPAYPPQ